MTESQARTIWDNPQYALRSTVDGHKSTV